MKSGFEYVYVIVERGSVKPVKIGRTTRPSLRVKDLNLGNHRELEIAWQAQAVDSIDIEARAHMALRDKRIRREWFDVTVNEAVSILTTGHSITVLNRDPRP